MTPGRITKREKEIVLKAASVAIGIYLFTAPFRNKLIESFSTPIVMIIGFLIVYGALKKW